jgi:hypothetical protein
VPRLASHSILALNGSEKENVMDREPDLELVELGTASTCTEGLPWGHPEEAMGYFPKGISDE